MQRVPEQRDHRLERVSPLIKAVRRHDHGGCSHPEQDGAESIRRITLKGSKQACFRLPLQVDCSSEHPGSLHLVLQADAVKKGVHSRRHGSSDEHIGLSSRQTS
jgi:hypothetical protein